jgi:hypothetical protein
VPTADVLVTKAQFDAAIRYDCFVNDQLQLQMYCLIGRRTLLLCICAGMREVSLLCNMRCHNCATPWHASRCLASGCTFVISTDV